jgi:hypothetical protein
MSPSSEHIGSCMQCFLETILSYKRGQCDLDLWQFKPSTKKSEGVILCLTPMHLWELRAHGLSSYWSEPIWSTRTILPLPLIGSNMAIQFTSVSSKQDFKFNLLHLLLRQYPRNCDFISSRPSKKPLPVLEPRCDREPSCTLAVRMIDSSPVCSDSCSIYNKKISNNWQNSWKFTILSWTNGRYHFNTLLQLSFAGDSDNNQVNPCT